MKAGVGGECPPEGDPRVSALDRNSRSLASSAFRVSLYLEVPTTFQVAIQNHISGSKRFPQKTIRGKYKLTFN